MTYKYKVSVCGSVDLSDEEVKNTNNLQDLILSKQSSIKKEDVQDFDCALDSDIVNTRVDYEIISL